MKTGYAPTPLRVSSDTSAFRKSSVRSAMFIANAPDDSQALLGAACDEAGSARRPMPVLTELDRDLVGSAFYKHGAPNGAFAEAGAPYLGRTRQQSGGVLIVTLLLASILGFTLGSYLYWVRTQNVLVAESQSW